MHVDRETERAIVDRLVAVGCIAAASEAAELVDAAPDPSTLERWVVRREAGEPLAWITGVARFFGRSLRVDPGVYVPRPQTEELASRAVAVLRVGGRAADLCTGSGAVASALAGVRDAFVVGVDLDPAAVSCARRNGVSVIVSDLGAPLRPRVFDVVTAVAPYVPTGELSMLPSDVRSYEPHLALDGGDDGLDVVRRAVAAAGELLLPGGWFLTELGDDQDRLLAPTLAASGFVEVTPWFDEEGDLRGLAARAG